MRKLLLLLICFVGIAVASDEEPRDHAIVTTDVLCTKTALAFKSLKEMYGEEAIMIGDSTQEQGVKTGVFVNLDTGTYTVIDFNRDVACVLSIGKNTSIRLPKQLKKSML